MRPLGAGQALLGWHADPEKFTEALESGNDSIYQEAKTSFMNEVIETFKDYKEIDMDIFVKMMEMYYKNVPKDQMPEIIIKWRKNTKTTLKSGVKSFTASLFLLMSLK